MFSVDVELPVTESDPHKQNLKLNFMCGKCHYGVIWIVSQLKEENHCSLMLTEVS